MLPHVLRNLIAAPPRDLTRTLLGVLVIGALVVASFLVVRPFLAATIWAIAIVVVTWPLLRRLERRLWGRRSLAVAAMMLILALLVVVPVTLAVGAVALHADALVERVRAMLAAPSPGAPAWLAQVPLVGGALVAAWQDAAASGLDGVWERVVPYAGNLTRWLVARAGTIGYLAVQFLLTLVLAGFLYAHGERYASAAFRVAARLGGKEGEDLLRLAGKAIRGVALGVVLTAAVQSVLGGIGLAIAGVPFAGVVTAVLFVLCIAQIGMLVVLLPVVAWQYWSGDAGWATFLLVWSLAAGLIDQVLRPMLVRQSADLPLLLVFVGVVGGIVAFGLLGIFVGPVVLAVAYTLLGTWLARSPPTT